MVNQTFHYTLSVPIELRNYTIIMFAGPPLQTLGLGASKLYPCQNLPLYFQPTIPFNVNFEL
jgi:hypothetical protein